MPTPNWIKLNQPTLAQTADVASARLIGATYVNDFIYAFVIATKKAPPAGAGTTSLWCKWWFNGWQPWMDMEAPPGTTLSLDKSFQGTAVTVGAFIYVFVGATDTAAPNTTKLWCKFWNGAMWNWVPLGTPTGLSVAAVGPAAGSPLCVWVKASDNTLWGLSWNGAMWIWARAAAGFVFQGTTDAAQAFMRRGLPNQFQLDGSLNLMHSMAGSYAVKTSRFVQLENTGGFVCKFKVRWRNHNGTQFETDFSPVRAAGEIAEFDLSAYPLCQAGADCWAYCDITLGKNHESGDNFNYDPAAPRDVARYEVSGGPLTPSFTHATPGPFINHGHQVGEVRVSRYVQLKNAAAVVITSVSVVRDTATHVASVSRDVLADQIVEIDLWALYPPGDGTVCHLMIARKSSRGDADIIHHSAANFVFDRSAAYDTVRYEFAGFMNEGFSDATPGPFINHSH